MRSGIGAPSSAAFLSVTRHCPLSRASGSSQTEPVNVPEPASAGVGAAISTRRNPTAKKSRINAHAFFLASSAPKAANVSAPAAIQVYGLEKPSPKYTPSTSPNAIRSIGRA